MLEPFSKQHDFSNHSIVRNHHTDRPEKRLQIVRQLCSSSVSGVHSNENSIVGKYWHHLALELKRLIWPISEQCHSNYKQLLSNNWQHLDIYSVELIQTCPCTLLSESLEQFIHHMSSDLVRTVEHNAESTQCLCKIFCWLSFSRSCRTSRRSS